jgi:hypothetical protein
MTNCFDSKHKLKTNDHVPTDGVRVNEKKGDLKLVIWDTKETQSLCNEFRPRRWPLTIPIKVGCEVSFPVVYGDVQMTAVGVVTCIGGFGRRGGPKPTDCWVGSVTVVDIKENSVGEFLVPLNIICRPITSLDMTKYWDSVDIEKTVTYRVSKAVEPPIVIYFPPKTTDHDSWRQDLRSRKIRNVLVIQYTRTKQLPMLLDLQHVKESKELDEIVPLGTSWFMFYDSQFITQWADSEIALCGEFETIEQAKTYLDLFHPKCLTARPQTESEKRDEERFQAKEQHDDDEYDDSDPWADIRAYD